MDNYAFLGNLTSMRKYGLDIATIAINACVLLTPVPGDAAGNTAFEAVQTLAGEYGLTSVGRIYEIRGDHGLPNPTLWALLLKEPNSRSRYSVREVTVSGGKVLSERRLPLLEKEIRSMPALNMGTLKIDSNQALRIASVQATKQQVWFHWVSYRLRRISGKGAVWQLKLFDCTGTVVGHLLVSAEDGSVLLPLVLELGGHTSSRSKSEWIKGGGLVGYMKSTTLILVHKVRNFTRQMVDKTKNTLLCAVGSTQEWITGKRTIGVHQEDGTP
jgi:hypothetical protein